MSDVGSGEVGSDVAIIFEGDQSDSPASLVALKRTRYSVDEFKGLTIIISPKLLFLNFDEKLTSVRNFDYKVIV